MGSLFELSLAMMESAKLVKDNKFKRIEVHDDSGWNSPW